MSALMRDSNRQSDSSLQPALRRRIGLALLCASALFGSGCLRGCTSSQPPIHVNPNMDNQPKARAQSESTFFYDGSSMRLPIAGTIARGQMPGPVEFETGKDSTGVYVASPVGVSDAVLALGERQFAIYCTPCHGESGDGNGMLATRGGVPVADLFQQRLIDMPDGQIFETITNGLGLMQGYRYPLSTADRWAVVSYVRQLQQQRQDPQ